MALCSTYVKGFDGLLSVDVVSCMVLYNILQVMLSIGFGSRFASRVEHIIFPSNTQVGILKKGVEYEYLRKRYKNHHMVVCLSGNSNPLLEPLNA